MQYAIILDHIDYGIIFGSFLLIRKDFFEAFMYIFFLYFFFFGRVLVSLLYFFLVL